MNPSRDAAITDEHLTMPVGESQNAHEISTADKERDERLAYYWRKGIPSLVLAIVTLVLAGYSYWFVQPNIQQRYRDICARNFQLLEKSAEETKTAVSDDANSKWGSDESKTNDAPSVEGAESRRRLLEETSLCLRRLILWDKADDKLRFQSATVFDSLADWYLFHARAIVLGEANQSDVGTLFQRSRAERQKATEAMRVAQRLKGLYADQATLWLAHQRLVDNNELPTAEFNAIAEQVERLVEKDATNQQAKSLLRELLVCKALRWAHPMTVQEREDLLVRAHSMPLTEPTPKTVDLAWAAEAAQVADGSAAQAIATRGLQAFWSASDDEPHSIETLVAAFRCLVIVNSIKECQLFVSERLIQVPSIDQARFRSLASAACMRQIAFHTILSPNASPSNVASQTLLSMAIQLNPESEDILSMLESIAVPTRDELLSQQLKIVLGLTSGATVTPRIGQSIENGLKLFLEAVVGLGDNSDNLESTEAFKGAIQATPVYGIVASRLATRLANAASISNEKALNWLATINAVSPEVLVAWSDRANLLLKINRPQEAVSCLEFLLQKLPGNEQVTEALAAAKSQAGLPE